MTETFTHGIRTSVNLNAFVQGTPTSLGDIDVFPTLKSVQTLVRIINIPNSKDDDYVHVNHCDHDS